MRYLLRLKLSLGYALFFFSLLVLRRQGSGSYLDRGERVRLEQSCSSSSNLRRPRGRTRPCVGSCEVSLVTLLRG